MSIPPQFPFFDRGKQVIMWADGSADLLPDYVVGDMLSVGDTHKSSVASQLHALYSFLELSCKGPGFTSI